MTATLAAVLVARDEVSWDTTVGAVFGDVEMDPAWREVTLAMLLTNSAGAPDDLSPGGLWNRLWMRAGSPVEKRRVLVAGVLGKPPVAPPGTRFLYSNAGFAIAGAMLETRTGRPYEALLAAELFAPLGMTRAGFGAPGEPNREGGEPDEPHGHFLRRGELQVRELGFGDDNPPAIAPAGLVHAPLRDWARYAALHLAGARGEPVPAAFHGVDFPRLHEPRLDGYAMGWVVSADGATLWHNGSNTMWYCEIALFPAEDLAVLVATNTAHGTAREAAAGVLRTLHERGMAPAGDAPR
jgi:CubicO group peptidase (beta-lactamase class C family)